MPDSRDDRTLCPGDDGYDEAGLPPAEPKDFRDEGTLCPDATFYEEPEESLPVPNFRDEGTLCPDETSYDETSYDEAPAPLPDPTPAGSSGRRPAQLLADLNATAWVDEEDAQPLGLPNQDATRWEMEVPAADLAEALEGSKLARTARLSPLPEQEQGSAAEPLDVLSIPTPQAPGADEVYDAGTGTWGKPGGPPPSVQSVAKGPPNLGVDPREELAGRLKLLCRRYPSFAPHSEFAFTRLDKLGEGGMGIVYRVLDKRLGRDAALKVLRIDSRSWATRFRREIEITAKLDHPAIPAVYEAGTNAAGEQYLLMRLIHGVELEDRIKSYHAEGRQPEELRQLLDYLLRLAEAMAYAHKRGVVHRDLKPANVMVGRFGEVFVMDWGLARILEEDADESLHHLEIETADSGFTMSGSVLGTPGYMPPEQARGEEVDARADVFALGAILTTILSGSPPVDAGTSSSDLVTATVQGKIVLPRERHSSISAELNSLAAAALAADREGRLKDGSAFVSELRAYLARDPLSVHRYSFRERLVRSARAQAGLLIGILVVLLIGGGASLVGVWALNREFEEAALLRQAHEDRLKTDLAELRQQQAEEQRAEVEKERQRIEEAMSLLAEASSAADEGERDEVETNIKAALDLATSRFLLWSSSDVQVRAGNLDAAIALLERSATDYAPGYRALYRIHLLTQRKLGGAEGETAALRRLRALAKERGEANVFTHLAEGVQARQRRDLERAEASFAAALAAAPGFAEARFEHGRASGLLAERAGDLAQAELGFSAAIRAQGSRPAGWALRAWLRLRRGEYAAATKDAERLVRLRPESADARALLAFALSFEGQIPKAIQAHKEAFLREAKHPMALAARAQVMLRRKRLESAREDLKAALAADPEPWLLTWLRQQLAALGDR